MEKKPTYQEQFNKLTEAYIRNKVNPYWGCARFVGNLLNNNGDWEIGRELKVSCQKPDYDYSIKSGNCISSVLKKECNNLYDAIDIFELEKKFLRSYNTSLAEGIDREDALFKAFEVTLDLLKQIHISKGEIIDQEPVFKKRTLATH